MGNGGSARPQSASSAQLAEIAQEAGKDVFLVELIQRSNIDSSKALALVDDMESLEKMTSSRLQAALAFGACMEWQAYCAEASTTVSSQPEDNVLLKALENLIEGADTGKLTSALTSAEDTSKLPPSGDKQVLVGSWRVGKNDLYQVLGRDGLLVYEQGSLYEPLVEDGDWMLAETSDVTIRLKLGASNDECVVLRGLGNGQWPELLHAVRESSAPCL